MASVGIALGYRAEGGSQIMSSRTVDSEDVDAGVASAQSTIVAGAPWQCWEISPAEDIWVTFGPNPTAAAGTSFKVWGGTTRTFAAVSGDKAAVINA